MSILYETRAPGADARKRRMEVRKIPVFSRLVVLFLAALSMAALPGNVFAGRPLITDDTSTQGKGRYLLEIGFDYARDNGDGVSQSRKSTSVEVDYGVADRVDLCVSSAYWLIQSDNMGDRNSPQGITDTLVELKWRFYQGDSGLSFAIKPGLSVPTGNYTKGAGSGDWRLGSGDAKPRLYFVATQEIGAFAFHFNAGYMRNFNKISAQQDLWHASLAGEWRFMKRFRFVCNVGIDTNLDKGTADDPKFILGGIIYTLTENIELDFGVRYGLGEPGVDGTTTSGVSIKF
jgi:hypothetical protein